MLGSGVAQAQGAVLQPDPTPVLQPAGIQGLLVPYYDRVNGLSLPFGVVVALASDAIKVLPVVTYRSRLGVVDPSLSLRVGAETGLRLEATGGRSTRSNDAWIYSNFVNSATAFFVGVDTRNYFRASGGEGRLFAHIDDGGLSVEPFIGGRYERVSSISAAGNVWSVVGRNDIERIRRPNPLVDPVNIGSALMGVELRDTVGVVHGKGRVEVERSLSTSAGTSSFTQLTADAKVDFPTFKAQRLDFHAHAVATSGDSISRSRYAYLGGSGTIPVLELLEQGGGQLVYVMSRYSIPLEGVLLPVVGQPIVSFNYVIGAAGVRALPALVQTIGAGLGLSVVHFDVNTDVARKLGTKVSLSISLD
ncbi:MAG: hypothetical protein ABJE47_22215 [bacterium]